IVTICQKILLLDLLPLRNRGTPAIHQRIWLIWLISTKTSSPTSLLSRHRPLREFRVSAPRMTPTVSNHSIQRIHSITSSLVPRIGLLLAQPVPARHVQPVP